MFENPAKWPLALVPLWILSVALGMGILWTYTQTPGLAATPPASWPQDSQVRRTPGRATLVLLAHPQCACTRASLGELDRLMARCKDLLAAHVLLVMPESSRPDWDKTELWRKATAIPGVSVSFDDGGIETRRFRARTSGQTLLYDASGKLLFHGGITGSRGHAGDNAGSNAIVSLLTKGSADRTETFVFGCSLVNEHSEPAERESKP